MIFFNIKRVLLARHSYEKVVQRLIVPPLPSGSGVRNFGGRHADCRRRYVKAIPVLKLRFACSTRVERRFVTQQLIDSSQRV